MKFPPTSFRDLAPAILKPTFQHIFVVQNKESARLWGTHVPVILVPVVVLLSPIPLASNHPVFWLFWSMVIGVCALVFSFFGPNKAKTIGKVSKLLMILGSVFTAFGLYQAVPLPLFFGGISVELPNQQATLPSLSITPSATMIAVIRSISYLIFFWLVLMVSKSARKSLLVAWVIYFGIALHALFAIAALLLFSDANFIAEKSAYFGKATGTFVNKNSFATFLGMGAILGLSLYFHAGKGPQPSSFFRNRYLRILSLGTISTALILTQSRLGISATLLAAFAISTPRVLSAPFNFRAVLATMAFFGTLMVLFTLQQYPGLQSSAVYRLDLYQQVLAMILDRPLTGFGRDSFALAFEIYHAPPVTSDLVWQKAHSSYLTLWVENGLIFGSIPLLLGGLAARYLHRNSSRCLFAASGIGALILAGLHAIFDFSLEIQANTFLFITLIGLGLGQVHKQRTSFDGSSRSIIRSRY